MQAQSVIVHMTYCWGYMSHPAFYNLNRHSKAYIDHQTTDKTAHMVHYNTVVPFLASSSTAPIAVPASTVFLAYEVVN